jgi:hypothetical protein
MSPGTVLVVFAIRLIAFGAIVGALLLANPKPSVVDWLAYCAAILAYLTTYLGDYYAFLRAGSGGNQNDVALFNEIEAFLKPEQVVPAFSQDLTSFSYDDVAPVVRFAESWDLPNKKFIDKKLEAARKELFDKASSVANAIATYTTQSPAGIQTVKLWGVSPQPQRIYEEAKIINEKARQFIKSYEALIRLGRNRLTL